ncbi:MAG: DUF5674 family protein [Patescibacteria group bacterium]|jgi:hypothetical protein
MEIIKDKISINDLKEKSKRLGDFVKAVVDVEKGIMAVDAEFHADLEALMLEQGSGQKYLWGINIYPEETGEAFVEFDSMINLRPGQENRSRGVESEEIRKKIIIIVNNLIER